MVTAGAPTMPVSLMQQLREGGSMAIPVGDAAEHDLWLVTRMDGLVRKKKICCCVFVKLAGAEAW